MMLAILEKMKLKQLGVLDHQDEHHMKWLYDNLNYKTEVIHMWDISNWNEISDFKTLRRSKPWTYEMM
jgi:hypothetical protein